MIINMTAAARRITAGALLLACALGTSAQAATAPSVEIRLANRSSQGVVVAAGASPLAFVANIRGTASGTAVLVAIDARHRSQLIAIVVRSAYVNELQPADAVLPAGRYTLVAAMSPGLTGSLRIASKRIATISAPQHAVTLRPLRPVLATPAAWHGSAAAAKTSRYAVAALQHRSPGDYAGAQCLQVGTGTCIEPSLRATNSQIDGVVVGPLPLPTGVRESTLMAFELPQGAAGTLSFTDAAAPVTAGSVSAFVVDVQ